MGRIVSNFFITLDGVVEDPSKWQGAYFDEAMGQVMASGMAKQRAFLLGRNGFDQWSEYWPHQGDDVPFARHINNLPKYVVTHRPLDESVWQHTTAISDNHAAEVQRVRDATDGDIALSGSATTVRWLIDNDLLDELHLLVHPVTVGGGQRLFEGTNVTLRLDGSEALPSGVVYMRYSRA